MNADEAKLAGPTFLNDSGIKSFENETHGNFLK